MENKAVISKQLLQTIFQNEEVYFVENKPLITKIVEEEVTPIQIKVQEPESILESKPKQEHKIIETNDGAPQDKKPAESIKKEYPLLVLVAEITVAEKVFLEKILNAVNLSIDTIEIFTENELKITDFKTFASGKTYQNVISFGMPFHKIGISKMFVPYQITNIKNIQFLMTELLPVIENDLSHKRQFWACLKQMFN